MAMSTTARYDFSIGVVEVLRIQLIASRVNQKQVSSSTGHLGKLAYFIAVLACIGATKLALGANRKLYERTRFPTTD